MGHLSVLDLLNLSRSFKAIRNVMLSKTFRPAWRKALRDLGAPECPPEISEPQFIRLVFDSTCQARVYSSSTLLWITHVNVQGCGAPRVWTADLGLYVRLCPGCSSMK